MYFNFSIIWQSNKKLEVHDERTLRKQLPDEPTKCRRRHFVRLWFLPPTILLQLSKPNIFVTGMIILIFTYFSPLFIPDIRLQRISILVALLISSSFDKFWELPKWSFKEWLWFSVGQVIARIVKRYLVRNYKRLLITEPAGRQTWTRKTWQQG